MDDSISNLIHNTHLCEFLNQMLTCEIPLADLQPDTFISRPEIYFIKLESLWTLINLSHADCSFLLNKNLSMINTLNTQIKQLLKCKIPDFKLLAHILWLFTNGADDHKIAKKIIETEAINACY